jgi:hypothetical protein
LVVKEICAWVLLNTPGFPTSKKKTLLTMHEKNCDLPTGGSNYGSKEEINEAQIGKNRTRIERLAH